MRRLRTLVCLSFAVAWGGGSVLAEEGAPLSGTLKTINDRGTILLGYRESSLPFSFLNKAGQPVGFSLDICHGIAEDVARTLNRDLLEADAPAWQTGVRIVYVPVGADQRLPKVISGAVDLECGSTTANAERAQVVAFSPVFFLSGTKLMVPAEGGGRRCDSYRDLAGRAVVVSAGTTNAEVMQRLASKASPAMKVEEQPSLDAAYEMLVAGRRMRSRPTTSCWLASSPHTTMAAASPSWATTCRSSRMRSRCGATTRRLPISSSNRLPAWRARGRWIGSTRDGWWTGYPRVRRSASL